MKKNLLLAAFLMGSFVTANAQEIFSEDFNSNTFDFETEGWAIYQEDDYTNNAEIAGFFPAGTIWSTLYFTSAPGNAFAASTSYFENEGEVADRWLVTPALDIPANGATLTFKDASGDVEFPDTYELYVSTTGNDVSDFGTTPILTQEVTGDTFTARTVDLSDYANETVYIAWRHHNADGFLLFVDDVVVAENATTGVKDVAASKLSVYPNPATSVVTVKGTDALVSNVAIADINGRTVKTVKFAGVAEAQVNVSDLASGVYVMTIASDKGTTTQKIVKN